MSEQTPEELARDVAQIIGSSSAAAAALAELDRLRAEGKSPALIFNGHRWIVVHDTGKQA